DYHFPTDLHESRAVAITCKAGYANDDGPPVRSTVPDPLKVAILLLVGHWYQHREAVSAAGMAPLPFAVEALIAPYRRICFGWRALVNFEIGSLSSAIWPSQTGQVIRAIQTGRTSSPSGARSASCAAVRPLLPHVLPRSSPQSLPFASAHRHSPSCRPIALSMHAQAKCSTFASSHGAHVMIRASSKC